MSLKVLTLNIEGDKHFDRFPQVIRQEDPDVLCLQEVYAADMAKLEALFGMHGSFQPEVNLVAVNKYHFSPRGLQGNALFTRQPHESRFRYFVGSPEHIPVFQENDPNAVNRVLLWTKVVQENQEFTIGSTHFTWTPNGETNETQRRDLQSLFAIIDSIGEIILCGDFNAPRGKEAHRRLSERLTDTVPATVQTTIDGSLHYAGPLMLVVDGIFTTAGYCAEPCRVLTGISDHCGLVTTVVRTV